MNKNCKCIIIHKEIVEEAIKKRIPVDHVEKISNFFKLFSDRTRLNIISLLLTNEMCVCDIAFALDMSHSSISHQLKILRQEKIVRNRKVGKVVYYFLDNASTNKILNKGTKYLTFKSK